MYEEKMRQVPVSRGKKSIYQISVWVNDDTLAWLDEIKKMIYEKSGIYPSNGHVVREAIKIMYREMVKNEQRGPGGAEGTRGGGAGTSTATA